MSRIDGWPNRQKTSRRMPGQPGRAPRTRLSQIYDIRSFRRRCAPAVLFADLRAVTRLLVRCAALTFYEWHLRWTAKDLLACDGVLLGIIYFYHIFSEISALTITKCPHIRFKFSALKEGIVHHVFRDLERKWRQHRNMRHGSLG
ncbi:hypothetical protein [Roseobacter sinensis]|uniref:Transposase n=1 Tax=Roseobacter sinensis TaxID=2931391 RepID=A0ABT3BLT1_9RHOB|nr:hypothetical protein [Roseobacter sp. WL0113]MCV3274124.1 hypothetical protein [Roseobacter sp. WL0113]